MENRKKKEGKRGGDKQTGTAEVFTVSGEEAESDKREEMTDRYTFVADFFPY